MKKFLSMILLFFLVSNVYAGLTGTIEGVVIDVNGQSVPGVLILIEGKNLQGMVKTQTDSNGRYRIPNLPSGNYKLRAELTGMKTMEYTELLVIVNKTTKLDITMELTDVEEVVTVIADAPVIDTKSSTQAITVEREFQERLPNSDDYQDAFSMGGGTTGSSNPNVKGGADIDNSYLMDGIDTTDVLTQTWGSALNADVIQEVEVQLGGISAEYGRSMGGVVNAITKSGSNELEVILRLKYNTDSLDADPKHEEGIDRKDYLEPTISIGFPILKDKLWFFGSFRYIDIKSDITVRNSHNFSDNTYELKTTDASSEWMYYFAKLTFQPVIGHSIVLQFNGDPAVLHAEADDIKFSPEAQSKQEQGSLTFGLSYTYTINTDFFIETKASAHLGYLNILPESDDKGKPSYYNRDAQLYTENFNNWTENDRNRYSFNLKGDYFLHSSESTHNIKSGIEYQKWVLKDSTTYPGGYYITTEYDDAGNEVLYQKDAIEGATSPKNEADYMAFFAQDSWEIFSGFTLNYGMRFENIKYFNDVDDEVAAFDLMVAPRLGFAWDINDDGKSKVYGSAGRYYGAFGLQLPGVKDETAPTYVTYRWDPTNPEADSEGWYEYRRSGGGGENSDWIDSSLKPEYTDELLVGYEYQVVENLSLGTSFTYRMTRDIIEDVGHFYNSEGDEVFDPYNEDWSTMKYEITNPNDCKRDYWGLEVNGKSKMDKLTAFASFTYSSTKGNVIADQPGGTGGSMTHFSVYYDTPKLSENLYGYLPWDSTYYFKTNLTYELPYTFFVGVGFFYRRGYAYSEYSEDEIYGQKLAITGDRGKFRYPDMYIIDLSLQKDFEFGKAGVLTIICDINNLTDNQEVVLREEETGSNLGKDLDWSSPRSIEFSLKYSY